MTARDEFHPVKPTGEPLGSEEAARLIPGWSGAAVLIPGVFQVYRVDDLVQVWSGDAMTGRQRLDADGGPAGVFESIVHTIDCGPHGR